MSTRPRGVACIKIGGAHAFPQPKGEGEHDQLIPDDTFSFNIYYTHRNTIVKGVLFLKLAKQ